MIKLELTVDYENVMPDDLIRALNANSAFAAIQEIQYNLSRAINKGYPLLGSATAISEEEKQAFEKVLKMIENIVSDLEGKFK